MREILFKAKRIDDGRWEAGYYVKETKWLHIEDNYVKEERHYICTNMVSSESSYIAKAEVDSDTLCQYTGLTDKNGNKIWENDIVKATVRQNSLCQSSTYSDFYQVAYHEKNCYFYLKKKNNNLLFDGNWSYYLKSIEVIGNIFDNPELLKGGWNERRSIYETC